MSLLTLYLGLLWLTSSLAPAQDQIDLRLAQARESDSGCLSADMAAQALPTTGIATFRQTRGLPDDQSARGLLSALLEYDRRPSSSAFTTLLRRHVAAGARPAVAEDIARCVYFRKEGDVAKAVQRTAAIPPAAVGLFWAGRVLHEDSREADALAYYQRALDADESNPRTRMFYGIALLDRDRGSEALAMFDGIRPDWAPRVTSYWRARALLALGRPREARVLLERLPERVSEPTNPDASTESSPVAAWSHRCFLATALIAEGELSRARDLLAARGDCRNELAVLELGADRPFEALVAAMESFEVTALSVEAMARLGACDLARRDLTKVSGPDLKRVQALVSSLCTGSKSVATQPPPAGADARLQAPRLHPFPERSIPNALRWSGPRPDEPPVSNYPALSNYTLVTASAPDERMFAVSVSQDVDPRGEVGHDPAPLVPRAIDDAGHIGLLWEALVEHLFEGPSPVQQTAGLGNDLSGLSRQDRPFASQRTLFIRGTPCPAPHRSEIRTICLPRELFARYNEKFGMTYPMAVPDIIYDRDRRRALIHYSMGWRGGTLLATWQDGRWQIKTIAESNT